MPYDPYDACPCGSGKKFKFCCHKVGDDIDKINGYISNHQMQAAMQSVDRVLKSRPKEAWPHVTKASLLMKEGEFDATVELLRGYLEHDANHPYATSLFAFASFAEHGYEASRPAIYRAFRLGAADFPSSVGTLAIGVANEMFNRGAYLAGRQFLAFALRVSEGQRRMEVFEELREYDSDRQVPYPLRSVHALDAYTPPEDLEETARQEMTKDAQRAWQSVHYGCFGLAAKYYAKLTEHDGENAQLWHNLGLCYAWDGQEESASEALHKAAELCDDYDTAVEWETVAQLLDGNRPESRTKVKGALVDVQSLSQVVSLLEEHPRFIVLRPGASARAGLLVLDRELPADAHDSLETLPRILGQVRVLSSEEDDDKQQILVAATEGESFDRSMELFREAAGENIVKEEDPGDHGVAPEPKDFEFLQYPYYTPDSVPRERQRGIRRDYLAEGVKQWPTRSMAALGDKSPRQAAEAGEKVKAAAAVFVLDALCQVNRHPVDVDATFSAVGVEAPSTQPVVDDSALATMSAMRMHRLPIADLSDEQLVLVLNRSELIRHSVFTERALTEALDREGCHEQVSPIDICLTLGDLAFSRGDRQQALEWVQRAMKSASEGDDSFEKILDLELHQLTYLAEAPDEPAFGEQVRHILDYYGMKVPEIREYVRQVMTMHGVDASKYMPTAGNEPDPGKLWTPGAQEEAAKGEEKKLWLPGS